MKKHITLKIILIIIAAVILLYLGFMIYVDTKIIKDQGITEMPDYFTFAADQQGSLEAVEYETSINGKAVTKRATVYLPYGYQQSKGKYEVLYLMHGRGGSYKTWLGEPGKEREFKNLIDNMIESGTIRPVIVVTPELSYDYGEDDDIMDGTAKEVTSELLPIIDKKYNTYGDRDHRLMAGFSMGGSLTWHMLRDYTDCFRYYIPMSMALYYDNHGYSELKSLRATASIVNGIRKSGYKAEDFSVYTATGEKDHKAIAAYMQVKDLLSQDSLFKYAENDYSDGNIMFKVWPERWHRYTQSLPYLYDGLGYFLGN